MFKEKRIKTIILSIVILLALVSTASGVRNAISSKMGSFDFQYDSAKYIALGLNPYMESLNPTGLQEQLGLGEYYGPLEANQFPSMLLMLIPFTLFQPMTANILFCCFNLFCTAGILILLKKMYWKNTLESWKYIVFCGIMLIGTPWRNNIGNGQHTIFSFFFILLSIWLSDRNKTLASGVSLSVAFFKYTLTVPMAIYFVYKKKYKELFAAVAIHVFLTLVSAGILHASVIDMIVYPLKISSGLSSNGSFDIGATFHLGKMSMLVAVIILALLLLYAARGKFPGTDQEMLAILTMISLIVIYHREYDYFVLILPLMVFGMSECHTMIVKIAKTALYIVVAYPFLVSRILYSFMSEYLDYFNTVYAYVFYITIAILTLSVYKNNKNIARTL